MELNFQLQVTDVLPFNWRMGGPHGLCGHFGKQKTLWRLR